MTHEDELRLGVFLTHRADGFSHIEGRDFTARMAVSLSVQRRYWPAVFRYVINTDPDAASIAVRRGWDYEERDPGDTWRTIDASGVRAKIGAVRAVPHPARQKSLGMMLAGAISRHASHHLGLMPPEWLAPRPESAAVVPFRQPQLEDAPA